MENQTTFNRRQVLGSLALLPLALPAFAEEKKGRKIGECKSLFNPTTVFKFGGSTYEILSYSLEDGKLVADTYKVTQTIIGARVNCNQENNHIMYYDKIGRLHREDGPAKIRLHNFYQDGYYGSRLQWFIEGKKIREEFHPNWVTFTNHKISGVHTPHY